MHVVGNGPCRLPTLMWKKKTKKTSKWGSKFPRFENLLSCFLCKNLLTHVVFTPFHVPTFLFVCFPCFGQRRTSLPKNILDLRWDLAQEWNSF